MEDNNLKIEQKCGEGIRGIGYDGKLWMCLDQGGESDSPVANEFQYNENTFASLKSEFQEVTFEKVGEEKIKIQIDSDHPAITMAKLLGDKEVQLRGISGWRDTNPFEFNKETEKWESELKWSGNFKECKIVIRDTEEREGRKVTKPIDANWNGNYGESANQKMEINLGEERVEDSE